MPSHDSAQPATAPHDPEHPAGRASKLSWLRTDRRYGTRTVLGGLAVALVAVPFALLLLLVEDKWGPLAEADRGARDGLHLYGLAHPGFVAVMRLFSNSGSPLAWQIVTALVVVWLLFRRLWRLAVFVVVTTAGSSLLNSLVKALVHRDRPLVAHPFVHEPGASFPSGHAQAAIVGYGVLLLVFLPTLRGLWRRLALAAATVMVLGIGFSRVALAAHYVSDVLAGFVLGGAWVAATTALFSAWKLNRGQPAVHPAQGLSPEDADRLTPPST
jgi:membrane-associated phospholipid phosphatase